MTAVSAQSKPAINALWLSKELSLVKQQLIHQHTMIFPNNTQLAIALIDNGKTSFYGVKRINDTLVYHKNQQSVFEIASITKVFTATLLADFVINEELKLSDDVNEYLDFSLRNNTKITLEQLANHTSGLPRLPSNLYLDNVNPKNPYKDYDEKKLIRYLTKKLSLENKPSEVYNYSNLGFGFLGYTLSEKSKLSYEKLLQQRIFSKYSMTASTTVLNNVKSNLVQGLDKHGNPTSNWDMNILSGAGGILSTIEDLSKFVIAHFDASNSILSLTQESTFRKNLKQGIGLGWQILNKNQANWIWHNGGTGGYSSILIADTKNKNSVIILCNLSNVNTQIEEVAFELMNSIYH